MVFAWKMCTGRNPCNWVTIINLEIVLLLLRVFGLFVVSRSAFISSLVCCCEVFQAPFWQVQMGGRTWQVAWICLILRCFEVFHILKLLLRGFAAPFWQVQMAGGTWQVTWWLSLCISQSIPRFFSFWEEGHHRWGKKGRISLFASSFVESSWLSFSVLLICFCFAQSVECLTCWGSWLCCVSFWRLWRIAALFIRVDLQTFLASSGPEASLVPCFACDKSVCCTREGRL